MSIPLDCPKCHEMIGVINGFSGGALRVCMSNVPECPGKGKHKKPVRTEKSKLFGLIKEVTVNYPETDTNSSWCEYIGAKKKFLVWLAIVFGTDGGITINGKWCWWEFKWWLQKGSTTGFLGDGAKEFQSV